MVGKGKWNAHKACLKTGLSRIFREALKIDIFAADRQRLGDVPSSA